MAIVYLAKNRNLPSLIKLGCSKKETLEERGLDSTSCPGHFEEVITVHFDSFEIAHAVEQKIFEKFKAFRELGKEFLYHNIEDELIQELNWYYNFAQLVSQKQ